MNNVGSSDFFLKSMHCSKISLNNTIHVPSISRNLLFFSKYYKDNHVLFEFQSDKCCVKSQGSKYILIEGFLDANGLYCFSKLTLKLSSFDIIFNSYGFSIFVHNHIVSNSILASSNNSNTSLLCYF